LIEAPSRTIEVEQDLLLLFSLPRLRSTSILLLIFKLFASLFILLPTPHPPPSFPCENVVGQKLYAIAGGALGHMAAGGRVPGRGEREIEQRERKRGRKRERGRNRGRR
jgi:hypothetical protein